MRRVSGGDPNAGSSAAPRPRNSAAERLAPRLHAGSSSSSAAELDDPTLLYWCDPPFFVFFLTLLWKVGSLFLL